MDYFPRKVTPDGRCHYSRFRSKQARGMAIRTVEHLIEETGIGYEEIATKSGLPVARVAAIAEAAGRRASYERECIAQAFGLAVTGISWGHTMNPATSATPRFKENLVSPFAPRKGAFFRGAKDDNGR
jgi:hypothetical protein